MMFMIINLITFVALGLIIYHHVGYPWLLKLMAQRQPSPAKTALKTDLFTPQIDANTYVELPFIHLIMPAFNEEAFIADKIRNLAAIDYPPAKFKISLCCDGCTDQTAQIAAQTLKEAECQHLPLVIKAYPVNRGKVAVLNHEILRSRHEIIALSDISALISIDALHILAQRFRDDSVGVVTGCYQLLHQLNQGEERYWQYQAQLKQRESMVGSTIGVHGAFYAFRRALFQPLEADTINDDFVLPMQIVSQGYRAVYEPQINALELETNTPQIEQHRRLRIAAGNLQQVLRLRHLFSLKHRWTAFNFFSGKALRAFMPWLLLEVLLASLWLSQQNAWFYTLLLPQLVIYLIAVLHQFAPRLKQPAIFKTIHYVVHGYWLCAMGELRYITGLEKGRWQRANR